MHGRLKVKSTEEQQEAKRKEREKKLQIYKTTTDKIFEKRKNGDLDKEMLMLTGELLSANPDFYTLWNIRRELIEAWNAIKSRDEMMKVFDDELGFLEQCLRVNPKSYGTWHQRGWIMDLVDTPAKWTRELALCSTYLEYDERNFHCWDYRRYVVRHAGVKPVDELQFTTDKIGANFSNFSSWHYRSRLLPLVHPDAVHPTGVEEGALINEFEMVQNAFFTDPNDQSAWFYHRWLLGQGLRRLSIVDIYLSKPGRKLMIILSRLAQMVTDFTLELSIDNSKTSVDWRPASRHDHSIVWVADLPESEQCAEQDFRLSLHLSDVSGKCNKEEDEELAFKADCGVSFVPDASGCYWRNSCKSNFTFSNELGAATSSTLSTELESCRQLHELEPDNKWVLLTILSLMRALDAVKHQSEMLSYIDKLLAIDPMRSNYYADLRSSILIELAICNQPTDSRSFVLTNAGLTVVGHLEHLFTATVVNLSHNLLHDLDAVFYLQSVRQLNVSYNRLKNCRGFDSLPAVESVDLRNNDIGNVADLVELSSCRFLHTALLDDNPVCSQPGFDIKNIISARPMT